jgi:hypothetical protein
MKLCRTYGPMLVCPEGVNGPRVTAAIAGNESSTGIDTTPRYERAYDIGGAYDRAEQHELLMFYAEHPPVLVDEYGQAISLPHNPAAYSYGPWQMLPCNAKGFSIQELAESPEKCAQAFVGFFNRYIIGHCHADTLPQIFEAYNSGHIVRTGGDIAPGVQRYINDGVGRYSALLMPTTVKE